ncbi:TIGR03084 family metal-binding protein [Geodermatophilus sabuli]|uniref:TIGR03084 family protein n=1 Tax=Geodermatophilus sabuli TaxID=1564158 RepID=A0A285E6F9_9ACTN|nr:TIGR03084 family metal-binding protein [Geodermatophilus sabuli]MBB3082535.1 uncharacterized protein (TIGR03084 family) [Geodermatophilus sabuli]SNX94597.1 TIGR03084 family protein [Geodermatophilus sabuli]
MTAPETDRADARAAAAAGRHRQVTEDLREETRSLQDVLDTIEHQAWSTPTPAAGWNVQDQINHLAYFDEAMVLAVTDPERFRRQADELRAPGGDSPDRLVRSQRDLTPEQSAAWFGRARAALLDLATDTSPSLRLPWYGPDMSITSAITARLMETWAHGQDVAEALGVIRPPTDRLRHIAHLGVATRAFSYRLRGLPVPEVDVAVELTAPSGDVWRWGDRATAERVTGTALDFCLVVTQRRRLSDTDLSVTGDAARGWMQVAQAFAGPPGPGREPSAAGVNTP